MPEIEEQITRAWEVDLEKIRDAFGDELAEDGAETDEDVAVAAFENGAREPYFIPTVHFDSELVYTP